jgi:hypothetical protein
MTDFGAQVRAAIQQVRNQTAHGCDEGCGTALDWHSDECDAQWQMRVDARFAACVEAMLEAAIESSEFSWEK